MFEVILVPTTEVVVLVLISGLFCLNEIAFKIGLELGGAHTMLLLSTNDKICSWDWHEYNNTIDMGQVKLCALKMFTQECTWQVMEWRYCT